MILIADDEPMVLSFLQRVLLAAGYQVLAARDGEEAMEISREYPGTIHGVVTDLSMPRLDGLELRRRISVERPGIRVLLISGYAASLADGSPLVRKPIDSPTVKRLTRDLLGLPKLKRRAGGR